MLRAFWRTATGEQIDVLSEQRVGAEPGEEGDEFGLVVAEQPGHRRVEVGDVEVEVGQLPGVQRLDIDDLQSFVDTNATQRQAAVPAVEAVIEQEMDTFMAWYSSREVTPVIHNLRRWANDVAQAEVAQALHKLGEADPHTADVVNRLAHRIVNKLLHEPTVRLRGQAVEGNGHGYAQAVLELFGLRAAECSLKQTICVSDGSTMDQMSCNLQCIMNEGNNQPYYE